MFRSGGRDEQFLSGSGGAPVPEVETASSLPQSTAQPDSGATSSPTSDAGAAAPVAAAGLLAPAAAPTPSIDAAKTDDTTAAPATIAPLSAPAPVLGSVETTTYVAPAPVQVVSLSPSVFTETPAATPVDGSPVQTPSSAETPAPQVVDTGDPSTPISSSPVSFASTDGTSGDTGAAPAAATPLNRIALENQKQGTPRSVWGLSTDIGDANIQGFATEISTDVGGTVDFKIATDSTHYRIEIYRLGYYGGDGARLVDTIDKSLDSAQVQPHPIVDMSLGLIDCGNWSVSASWGVPADAVSGVYFAKLVREDGTSGENIIPFVVRDDNSTSDIVFQTSDTTWQAYNPWGGANLYGGDVPLNPNDMIAYMPPNCHCGLMAIGRAYAVSYNRPMITATNPNFLYSGPQDYLFGEEWPAIQWLEQNGYDVSYISGVDAARSGQMLLNHDVYLSVGHDEYWSGEQRDNVTAARDAGVNLAFWSGNECYWKVQWNDSIDGSATPYRTMTCYKETWANADINPALGSTATWRDPRFADPGQEPENSLTGQMFQVDSWRSDTITIPYDMTQLRFWRNTDVANTAPGGTASLNNGILGYEWDADVDNGFRPAGLINMSLSNISVDTYLLDYGNTVGAGDAQHSLTMYRDQESGALVFAAGTVMWSWGLNAQHDLDGVPVDPNVQQAMVNMFADMGVQPTTLDASLTLATQSTDHTAPVAAVSTPTAGASFTEGQKFTISGTAQDFGGGRVAGIEVSVDGGNTWRKATGTTNWTYTWIAQASGNYQIVARATDDSLNIGAASGATQVQVTLPPTSSLWTYANTPVNDTEYERNGVELGTRFVASTDGTVTGVRFYKGFLNQGTHTGSLWSASGQLLATGTFTGETATGWQVLTFSTPISIEAGLTYVVSYHSNGYYAYDADYFDSARQNGLLAAPVGAGVYGYGDTSTFPGQSSDTNGNYWVDVVFNPEPNQGPVANDDGTISAGWNKPLVLAAAQLLSNDSDPNEDVLSIVSVGNASHGSVAYNATDKTVTFTPVTDYSGAASFTYTISDGRGGTATATVNLDIKQGIVGASLFAPTDAPASSPQNDSQSVELGVKFTVSATGTITGIRYYKSAQDTGTHTGSLWTSTGTLLAQATFSNETASGWQTLTFANPITVSAGTTYVASYHSNGYYLADGGYFTNGVTNGPLTAPSSTSSGGNGVYAYGANPTFPGESFNSANYWVDVTYDRIGSGPNQAPVAHDDSGYVTNDTTPLAISVASLLANDTDADGDTLTVTAAGAASQGVVSRNGDTITFTPEAGYFGPVTFVYTISDGRGGASAATVSLNVQQTVNGTSLFAPTDTPAVLSENDANAVELGMKFTVGANGTITGMRYYKGAGDSGTHVGSLWTASGTLLATATFGNETASGWQTVSFSSPVSVAAGTTYIVSYQSNGHYAATANYFTTAHSNGGITAPAGANGVFNYGTGANFPDDSWSSTNYWVDVVYSQGAAGPNHDPVANADAGFTTTSGTPVTIAASALLANDNDQDGDTLTVTGVSGASNGTVAFDANNNTVTFTPTSGYAGGAAFTYAISDGRGGVASANVSLTVQQAIAGASLFSATDVPANLSVHEPVPVELGMKFSADVAGTITGIRFYKAANENGAHTASLWTTSGQLLAQASFSNETASGWQTAALTQPVQIAANTQYVVSYGSNGDYVATGDFFATDFTSGHLRAPADAPGSGNGLYAYGAAGTFPNETWGKSNYYVDVLFQPLAA